MDSEQTTTPTEAQRRSRNLRLLGFVGPEEVQELETLDGVRLEPSVRIVHPTLPLGVPFFHSTLGTRPSQGILPPYLKRKTVKRLEDEAPPIRNSYIRDTLLPLPPLPVDHGHFRVLSRDSTSWS